MVDLVYTYIWRERRDASQVNSYIARLCGGRGDARVPRLTFSVLIIHPFHVKTTFLTVQYINYLHRLIKGGGTYCLTINSKIPHFLYIVKLHSDSYLPFSNGKLYFTITYVFIGNFIKKYMFTNKIKIHFNCYGFFTYDYFILVQGCHIQGGHFQGGYFLVSSIRF